MSHLSSEKGLDLVSVAIGQSAWRLSAVVLQDNEENRPESSDKSHDWQYDICLIINMDLFTEDRAPLIF